MTDGRTTNSKKRLPNFVKFVFGGSAGMGATLFVQPLDLLKNRMQLNIVTESVQGRSSLQVIQNIIKNEGPFALYNGLSAGLVRQATYTTTRLGVYTWLLERYTQPKEMPPFWKKTLFGMTAGGIGSLVGSPAEISLIRMTSDGRLPKEQKRNYKNVFNAFYRIVREEGPTTLWRGCGPTIMRAMVVNAAQLATYSQAKQMILKSDYVNDGIFCHFCASMISGLATTIASMPVDIIKTRIQSMRVIDGKPEYRNSWDVLVKVIRNEGPLSLWKGFTPYYFRLGPHTVLTFIILEQMNAFYFRYVLGLTDWQKTL